VRLRGTLTVLLAIGASSCTCAPAPEPERAQVKVPIASGLDGRVAPSGRTSDGRIPTLEIRAFPEAAVSAFVASRIDEARKVMEGIGRERARARRDAEAALAEADRTSQEWKATNDDDLYRRVEIQLRRPRDPGAVAALHADLLARKRAAYDRATRAARRSDEKEQAFLDLEQNIRRYREVRFFVQGMTGATQATRTDGLGRFWMDLPPGRHALIALAEAGPEEGVADEGWLVWVDVPGGAREVVVLDEQNRHGTDCARCVVPVKELP